MFARGNSSQPCLHPNCPPCWCPSTGSIWTGCVRSCSLLEKAWSCQTPSIEDLLLRTKVFLVLGHQTSWELCYQIVCEFPNTPGPFDSTGLVFSLPSQSPSLPQSTLPFPLALRCLLQSNSQHAVQLGQWDVNTGSTLWQSTRVGKFCFL